MALFINLHHLENPFSFESLAYDFSQPYIERPIGYPYYHWLQTAAGSGIIKIKDKKFLLEKGHGILIAPFVPHKYFPVKDTWYTNFISFSGYLASEIPKMLGSHDFLIASDSPSFSFSDFIRNSFSFKQSDNSYDLEQLSISTYTFLIMLKKNSSIDPNTFSGRYVNYMVPVLDIIHTKYTENITTQQLADCVYISPQYLGKLFKHFLGISTYQYIKTYRLNKAKELLLTSHALSISEICYRVGFSDTSRFIQTFKAETGYTPAQYKLLSIDETSVVKNIPDSFAPSKENAESGKS